MYQAGVFVRRVEDITEALWGNRVSSSTISDLNQKILERVGQWRNRSLEARHSYLFVNGNGLNKREVVRCRMSQCLLTLARYVGWLPGGGGHSGRMPRRYGKLTAILPIFTRKKTCQPRHGDLRKSLDSWKPLAKCIRRAVGNVTRFIFTAMPCMPSHAAKRRMSRHPCPGGYGRCQKTQYNFVSSQAAPCVTKKYGQYFARSAFPAMSGARTLSASASKPSWRKRYIHFLAVRWLPRRQGLPSFVGSFFSTSDYQFGIL